MALVVTMWAIALLTLVSAGFMATTRTETRLARNLVENAKAEALADAGVYRATAALLDPDPAHWPRVDGTIYSWAFGGGEILISVQDEAGKIDLNNASDQLLESLLTTAGRDPAAAKQLVDAIRDFADPDNLRRINGAEDADYRAAGLGYDAKDASFESVLELQQVLGMTFDLYERIAPVLTIYSGARSIDPTVAPRESLLALPGATAAQVEAVLKSRSGESEASATGTRPIFGEFASSEGMGAASTVMSGRARSVFTITAIAQTPDGGNFERQAIVRLTGDALEPFLFHEWRRAWRSTGTAASSDKSD